MESTPRSILQDKTNLISETNLIKQSGKGLRNPVEKVSEIPSPTPKNLEKSVSKQTVSSDSCSFNSALQSSDTDATATADYDSAGESEFVLAPDSHEQKENLDLTLLANSLDGIHIASPQSDSHPPHDCSLFAVKFTKSESSPQDLEELSSEPNSSIVESDQENEGSLSGILNLSNVSVEETTVARTTPLEFLASVQNFENSRLSAARNLAAESNEIDAFDILESHLQAENPFNDSNLPESNRSFSGIPNLSNVSYEEISITGLTPLSFIAAAENFENSQVAANNATVGTEEDLIENRSQLEDTPTDPHPLESTAENIVASPNQTVSNKEDLIDSVEEFSSKEFNSPLENSVLNSSLNVSTSAAPVELKHPVDSTFQLNSDIQTSNSPTKQEADLREVIEENIKESPKKSPKEESSKIAINSLENLNESVAAVSGSLTPQKTDSSSVTDKNAINSSVIDEPAVSKCSQLDEKTKESSEISTTLTVESCNNSIASIASEISSLKEELPNLLVPTTETKEIEKVTSDLFQTASPLIKTEGLVEDSHCTVGTEESNFVANNQETLKGSPHSDFKNNADDLNNDSPANVSISKELSVTITDDLTQTVISDLLAKAGNLTCSESQVLLNGSNREGDKSGNLETECIETELDCPQAISPVNRVCDQASSTENSSSEIKEVLSLNNVTNAQTAGLVDASTDKSDIFTVQTVEDVEKVDSLDKTCFSKELTDKLIGEESTEPQKPEILKSEVDESICKEAVTDGKTSCESVEKSPENLNNKETGTESQLTTAADVQEPLPKLHQVEAAKKTDEVVPENISNELNGNIVKSETDLICEAPCQESSGEAKDEIVSEKSDLNASFTSLDESLPLLDAIDESFEVRTEDKFENFNSSLNNTESKFPEQEKIVSTRFCIANLNKSATDEPITEPSKLGDKSAEKTNAGVSEPVENCLKQASLNDHDTPVDDLKNNNCPEVICVDSSPESISVTSPNSTNTTQIGEEKCYGVDSIAENDNKSFSIKLDDVPATQSIEASAVGELKTEESAYLQKDILEKAFNKLSIEIRGDLLIENSPLKEEASKVPDNNSNLNDIEALITEISQNDNTALNEATSSISTDEKRLVEENNVVEIESKSDLLSEDSKIGQIEFVEPTCEKNENIEELNFDESLTEQALNLSREILLNSEDQMSDNFTVEIDSRMSSPAKTGGPKSNRVSFESNGLGNHAVGEDLDKTFEKQSESPTFDSTANSSEAGPITAEEFSIPASAFQFDLDSLPCGVRNSRFAGTGLTRNSLYVKFDPIVGKILANTENSPGHFLPPPTSERLEEPSLERTPMKNPALDEKLISITPCSTVGSGDANSSVTEQLDSSIDSVSNKTIENATLNKTDPDITQCVRNLSFEAESKQSSSCLTPQNNKLQTSKTTPRGTVVSQEYYLKELEKLQDLMSKQEQGYQEELNRNTEKMEKLQIEISTLKKEMHSKAKALSQSDVVLGEYERTISQLVAQNEADKKQFEQLKEKLIQERDTVTIHLNNTEIAFNDVHQKYERSKLVIEEMKNIQDALKASNQEYEKLLKAQEDKYNKLRSHVAGQLEKANHEMETMIRNHKDENDRLRAKLKQAEIANKSLESAIEQKTKENKELTQILDELIGKVGADGV